MRRVLATESAAHRAEKEARAEAESRLEAARSDARAIEARAVERVQRMHQQAREADARQREALWDDARERLARLESETPGEAQVDRAADRVAGWLTGAGNGGFHRGGPE